MDAKDTVPTFAAAVAAMNIKANLILENQATIVRLLSISVATTAEQNSNAHREFDRVVRRMVQNTKLAEKMIEKTIENCGV